MIERVGTCYVVSCLIGFSFSFRLFGILPVVSWWYCVIILFRTSQPSSLNIFEDFKVFWTRLPFPPFSSPRFCVDILFRTFLDFFYLSPVTSFTWCFLSKILRGHIVPHFLRFLSSLLCPFGFLEFSPLIFFVILCPSLGVSYLRFCVDILFRTFLDFSLFFLLTSSNLFYSLCLYSLWFCVVILSSTFTYSPLYRIFAFLSLHFSLPSFFGRRSSHKFTFLLCFWLFLCCKILRSLYLFLPVTLREHIAPHLHCFPHCWNFFLFTWTPIASISVFYSEVFKLRHCNSAWTYCSALSQFSRM